LIWYFRNPNFLNSETVNETIDVSGSFQRWEIETLNSQLSSKHGQATQIPSLTWHVLSSDAVTRWSNRPNLSGHQDQGTCADLTYHVISTWYLPLYISQTPIWSLVISHKSQRSLCTLPNHWKHSFSPFPPKKKREIKKNGHCYMRRYHPCHYPASPWCLPQVWLQGKLIIN
jgi:hypothetical protein